MHNVDSRGLDLLTTRWLALGAAAGVTVALLMVQIGVQGPWQLVALVLALLALFATSAVAFSVRRREIHALAASAKDHDGWGAKVRQGVAWVWHGYSTSNTRAQ